MRPLAPFYIAVMAAVAVVAFLMTKENYGAVTLYATMGIGFPLLFAATLLPYMACFLPMMATISWRLTLPICVALAAAWAIVPAWLSAREAERTAVELTRQDYSEATRVTPRTFELRTPQRLQYLFGDDTLSTISCLAVCKSLLASGEVDWFRIVLADGGGGGRTSTRFVAATGAACSGSKRTARTDRGCVLPVEDDGLTAELVAEIIETRLDDQLAAETPMVRIASFKQRGVERILHTEVRINVIRRGSALGPEFHFTETRGLAFWRKQEVFNPIEFPVILRSLGYKRVD